MSNLYYILIPCLILLACQASPVSTESDGTFPINEQNKQNVPACQENTNSGDCALLLSSIDYDFPDQECQVYDRLIQIDTKFKAPAGLEDGSTTRVDWEFFPDGNAGFWTMPIEDTELNEGTIRILGCFTYGEQTILKIKRSITDHDGVVSNTLSIDIPRPKEKGNVVMSKNSGFKILTSEASLH
ncbi:MAG: hypothetical protein JJ971_12360 [Balneolaceae bacterium]|nr:hypothetical protein [Balneolaceae bacterium]MBO6547355.1 hypothetical protein [Balneolaceae bacterium]MBO6647698.1 hypothetical protein [Balneolaceae bacterium]